MLGRKLASNFGTGAGKALGAVALRSAEVLKGLHAGAGLREYSAHDLQPMRSFSDIVVVPWQHTRPPLFRGGPIWPNWDYELNVRQGSHGGPRDEPPETRIAVRTLDEPVVWGGASREPHPVRGRAASGPAALRGRAGRAVAECRPLRRLSRPSRWELEEQATPPNRGKVVYVSRSALTTKGCHAGETYLCSVLQQLGVSVIWPEAMPLREQLQRYAGAEKLVFAEGSALHGRQLLGRLD